MSNIWVTEYASGESSATAGKTFPTDTDGTLTTAKWLQCIGAGTVVAVCEGGRVFTKHATGGEVYKGSFTSLTSTTCQYVVMGNGPPPPAIPASGAATVLPGSLGPAVAIAVADQATRSGLAQTIDGVAISSAGMRVYLANQTTGATGGMWVAQAGNWTRPADWATGATIPLGTRIAVAPGGTANFATFGSVWYVDSATDVVDTGTITAYPVTNKGQATLTSASPSTVTVSNLWIKSASTSVPSVDNMTTAANGLKAAITAGAGTGTIVITGPNTVTDVAAWLVANG